MHDMTVQLGDRSYPIHIGSGTIAERWLDALGPKSVVITSETVAALHIETLRRALGTHPHTVMTLPDGEQVKSLDSVDAIVRHAVEAGVGRDGSFIAFGGGVIGDVTGFAAATFHRGIAFIQVPTTLLAQVDSSVGGKTAVNHALGKNLIGAFHQPRRVIIDTDFLATLPPRERSAGMAEIIKTLLLDGEESFDWLEQHMDELMAGDATSLAEVIYRCCAIKARIVAADETEQGQRAQLNLGHTFGHALETAYAGALVHGEAVALGLLMAAHLSQCLGWVDPVLVRRVRALIEAAGLPSALPAPAPDAEALLELMGRDKKNLGGQIRLVLLRGPGQAVVTADYPRAALDLTLREFTGAPS